MAAGDFSLSDADQARIRAEEIYRAEIRSQLQTAADDSPKRSPVLEFFNSPLGLWLLSGVFVGFLSWAYSNWEEDRAERVRVQAQVAQLDIEIGSRFTAARRRLQAPKTYADVYDSIQKLSQGTGVIPVYAGRNFDSLLYELGQLIDADERGDVEEALDAFDNLRTWGTTTLNADRANTEVAPVVQTIRSDYFAERFAVRGWN